MLDLRRKIKPFLPGETRTITRESIKVEAEATAPPHVVYRCTVRSRPSGGTATRGALQNVLTVEWSGHKTVLVEVPSGPSRSNEVELSPLRDDSRSGAGNNGYGRLDDEDSDDSYPGTGYFDQPRSSRERKSSIAKSRGNGTAPPLPSRPSRPQPQFNRPELGPNPFDADSTYSRSNLFTQSQSSSSHRSGVSPSFIGSDFDLDDQHHDHDDHHHHRRLHHAPPIPDRPQQSARSRAAAAASAEGWTTFESPLTSHGAFPTTPAYPAHPSYSRGAGGKYDAWSKGGWSQTTSPASSTGTRNSGQMSLDDDPFREPEA
ncbi:hypothetical protein JCM24511_02971 [Saitozyma sp. JCM 24511]|nr:hypothetical protein JCM24511_02971 [Saitozyma sp. JCM 24511]